MVTDAHSPPSPLILLLPSSPSPSHPPLLPPPPPPYDRAMIQDLRVTRVLLEEMAVKVKWEVLENRYCTLMITTIQLAKMSKKYYQNFG